MEPEVKRLNQLMWQPGTYMHASWWPALELEKWQHIAGQNRLLTQRVNKLIISLLPAIDRSMPASLNDKAKMLLNLGEKLLVLLTGVGLVLLNSPDYITMKPYRETLLSVFSFEQIQQMLSLWPQGGEEGQLEADELINVAQQMAIHELNQRWSDWQVWQALKPTLPYVHADMLSDAADTTHDAERWLMRLERFL